MFTRESMFSARPNGPHGHGRADATAHLGSISRTLARVDRSKVSDRNLAPYSQHSILRRVERRSRQINVRERVRTGRMMSITCSFTVAAFIYAYWRKFFR